MKHLQLILATLLASAAASADQGLYFDLNYLSTDSDIKSIGPTDSDHGDVDRFGLRAQ